MNRLPARTDQQSKPLLRLLKSSAAEFIVIDSIDELHPDDYVAALEQMEEFVFSTDRDFLHLVVFGRPCAFIDYWATRREQTSDRDLKLFLLNAPRIRTTGDLLVSNWNYCTWKFDARRRSPDGKLRPLTLQDYVAWSQAGFSRRGLFRAVTLEKNDEVNADVQDAIRQAAQRHQLVATALRNLAGNGIIREIIAESVNRGREYDERQVMDAYFEAWLERDH